MVALFVSVFVTLLNEYWLWRARKRLVELPPHIQGKYREELKKLQRFQQWICWSILLLVLLIMVAW